MQHKVVTGVVVAALLGVLGWWWRWRERQW
jgi:hypothetical protein